MSLLHRMLYLLPTDRTNPLKEIFQNELYQKSMFYLFGHRPSYCSVPCGNWIATVSLKAFFTYNHITAGVTGTEYAKSLASGWSYTNHKITTTTVSSSNGGTATLTATLKDFPIKVPVRLSLHCSPDGVITR